MDGQSGCIRRDRHRHPISPRTRHVDDGAPGIPDDNAVPLLLSLGQAQSASEQAGGKGKLS